MLKRSALLASGFAALLGLAATADAQTTLRLSHAQPTDDVMHLAAERFKEAVESASEGEIQVEIFPAGQLGAIRDTIEGLRTGTTHAVIDAPSRLAVYTEFADVFKLPYLIETREEGDAMWSSQPGQELLDTIAEDSGIRVVGVGWRGARHITANREIRSPQDMEGLKIRTPPYDLPVETFRRLGANPTPMEFNEVYLGLQQGIIDAQENPLTTNWSNRLYEVTDYLVLTGHVKDFSGLMMGEDFVQDLPEAHREAVFDAASRAMAFYSDYTQNREEELLGMFRDEGVTVIEVDEAEFRAEFDGFIEDYNPKLADVVEPLLQVTR